VYAAIDAPHVSETPQEIPVWQAGLSATVVASTSRSQRETQKRNAVAKLVPHYPLGNQPVLILRTIARYSYFSSIPMMLDAR
jgi:hypothetical protein